MNKEYFKKDSKYKEIEFKKAEIGEVTDLETVDFYLTAKVKRVRVYEDSRNLFCVDRFGSFVDIKLWKEYNSIDIN